MSPCVLNKSLVVKFFLSFPVSGKHGIGHEVFPGGQIDFIKVVLYLRTEKSVGKPYLLDGRTGCADRKTCVPFRDLL